MLASMQEGMDSWKLSHFRSNLFLSTFYFTFILIGLQDGNLLSFGGHRNWFYSLAIVSIGWPFLKEDVETLNYVPWNDAKRTGSSFLAFWGVSTVIFIEPIRECVPTTN